MKWLCSFCALVMAAMLAANSQSNPTPPSEVHALYVEDQKDRGIGGHSLPWDQTEVRDRARRTRVHELLEKGALSTGEDFHDAAFIYQHGQAPDDYLLAHILADAAIAKGDRKSLWISAATLDRYLSATHQPQIFGTQYQNKDDSPYTQEPYNRGLIPDQLRTVFCVPSLQQQQANLPEFNAGRYPAGIFPKGCSR
jgi:hypothetical protein